ncbi:MAG: hypothetical protein AB7K68_09120 [Bacteriovoracia bacterium]
MSLVNESGKVILDCPEEAVSVGLNKKHENKIDREPAQATFQVKRGQPRFTIASVHLVPTAKKPANEVPWLFDSVDEIKGVIIVVGDFNLGSSHQAFKKAYDLKFVPVLDAVPTSLKMNTRSLNQAYDNLWVRGAKMKESTVVDLYRALPSMGQKDIYNNVSDHSPVSAVFGM